MYIIAVLGAIGSTTLMVHGNFKKVVNFLVEGMPI